MHQCFSPISWPKIIYIWKHKENLHIAPAFVSSGVSDSGGPFWMSYIIIHHTLTLATLPTANKNDQITQQFVLGGCLSITYPRSQPFLL